MSQLLTQCPFCQTTFKVSDAQMQAASGVVRCGACMEVFLASQHRVILKEKPAPSIGEAPRDDDVGDDANDIHHDTDIDSYNNSYNDSHNDSYNDSYNDIDNGPFTDSDDAFYNDIDDDADDDTTGEASAGESPAGEHLEEHAEGGSAPFTSWEAEEDHRRAEARARFPGAGEIAGTADDDATLDQDTLPPAEDAARVPDEAADTPAQAPERPAFSAQLNPAGYSMTQFSVESLLSGIFGPAGSANDGPAGETAPDEAGESEDAGDRAPPVTAPAKTAVVVPDRGERIPTLEPDVVAREEIPASGIGAQTLNWFQSLRRSLRDSRAKKAEQPATDEKAEIRRRLMSLRDEDSLDPVDSAHLEALAAEPVELDHVDDPWRRLQGPGLAAAAVLLLLVMAGQYVWFNLDNLVLDRRLPAVTEMLCRLRTCPDASAIDLSAVVTEELVVRSHPARDDALRVDFIFRNDKNREQRFPLVELNFTNNAGDVIANRVFTASEYLPEAMQLFTVMPAHSSIQGGLELVDPGAEATGYYLVFRNP